VKVQNYVAANMVDHPVDLCKVYEKCKPEACYEPELFRALIYKMKKYRLTALIFHSGKFIMTGSKQRSDINRANIVLKSLLAKCAK